MSSLISFYFYAIISIKKNLMKLWYVMQWYVRVMSTWSEVEYMLQNAKHMLFNTVLINLDCTTFSKYQNTVTHCELQKYVSISFYFDFYFTNCMQNYPTMSRQHSGKKLLVTTEGHFAQIKFQVLDFRSTWSSNF